MFDVDAKIRRSVFEPGRNRPTQRRHSDLCRQAGGLVGHTTLSECLHERRHDGARLRLCPLLQGGVGRDDVPARLGKGAILDKEWLTDGNARTRASSGPRPDGALATALVSVEMNSSSPPNSTSRFSPRAGQVRANHHDQTAAGR